jgi:hypothetical protein
MDGSETPHRGKQRSVGGGGSGAGLPNDTVGIEPGGKPSRMATMDRRRSNRDRERTTSPKAHGNHQAPPAETRAGHTAKAAMNTAWQQ